jgi:hypothetical protein
MQKVIKHLRSTAFLTVIGFLKNHLSSEDKAHVR